MLRLPSISIRLPRNDRAQIEQYIVRNDHAQIVQYVVRNDRAQIVRYIVRNDRLPRCTMYLTAMGL